MRYTVLLVMLFVAISARPEEKRKANRPVNPDEVGPNFQGDIVLTPEQQNGLISPARHWADGIMYYAFSDEFPLSFRDTIFQSHADFISMTDGCLSFVERTDQRGYVLYTSVGEGCFSSVGYTSFAQDMNFPQWCIDQYGSVLHEHLHAYGLYHEQSRYDRDEYVTIVEGNIEPDALGNFDIVAEDVADGWGEDYDYFSVMHYSEGAFAIDNTMPTIITTDPDMQDVIGQRDGMSESDLAKLKAMYNCP